MSELEKTSFAELYASFQAPIAALNCGERCSPHNERGVPFCCDPRHAVPKAYAEEWEHLQVSSDLWREWEADDPAETARLRGQAPTGQRLVVCRGHTACQRGARTLTCRAFPFFPYFNRQEEFVGLSYYWEFEDRCWVISNLAAVSPDYRGQFIAAYESIFEKMSDEKENFVYQSKMMRQVFGRRHRTIPLLHRNGGAYKITPRNGRMRKVPVESLPKFGPYRLAAELPFPDEL